MIYNYKYPVPGKSLWELAQEGGAEFELYYSEGLPSSADLAIDKYGLLISTYQLFGLPPQTYTLDGWGDFLQRLGPLCVIVDTDAPNNRLNHLVVMQGVEWTSGFSDAWFHLVDTANEIRECSERTRSARFSKQRTLSTGRPLRISEPEGS
ncbi:MAG: hypothetical protein KJ670_21855 [Alphaproteobacteria bacterium]|nr:hypothetical protein [Rhizobiaceae bacterium]MBU3962069.1 hypothetical protein [Alphaproteobacteria bacterium]MBU4048138.1 hypothetical protein [Alphaproteobacteria bacterium]MBU4091370.1 hypothetical protein [Alphaproteobacteria bacterium]MBU4159073.1 hypothetical protein [Alphaproteobacteria bacterium]